MTPAAVSVPASSANLGPGFDALGLALTIRAEVGAGDPPPTARLVEETHPAAVAHRHAGGDGAVWVRSPIPMARGLGYSGAMRVGGVALAKAVAEPEAVDVGSGALPAQMLTDTIEIAATLEGHPDNVAASTLGGVVVTAAGHSIRIETPLRPQIVVWIPQVTTSTAQSRTTLPDRVPFADAVDNLARSALLVAALVTGRVEALRDATADRLHQDRRLVRIPGATDVLAAGLEAGAWCGWLSGSGPTLAFMTTAADDLEDALRRRTVTAGIDARITRLMIDQRGVHLTKVHPTTGADLTTED